jgi:putative transposase
LRNAVNFVRQNRPFTIDAWVLLPEHLHCVWTLPPNDTDYSTRWNLIKSRFSKNAKTHLHKPEFMTPSKYKHHESTIWQRRFWEHRIRGPDDFQKHFDYIHYNPVKHKLVQKVKEWPYSTFHQYVRQDIYSERWGGGAITGLNLE